MWRHDDGDSNPPDADDTSSGRELLDDVIAHFLATHSTIPSMGKWEAIDEAHLMLLLMIRNIEGVTTLAQRDLVFLPGAMVMARVAFETGVTVRWMLAPDEPYEWEMRWLRTGTAREAFYRDAAALLTSNGQGSSFFTRMAATLHEFHESVAAALPPKFRQGFQPKKVPNVRQMLQALGQEEHYVHYAYASQFAHGTQAATALYRRHLGTAKEFGEYVTPAAWQHCLFLCWFSLSLAGQQFLARAGGNAEEFLPARLVSRGNQAITAITAADGESTQGR